MEENLKPDEMMVNRLAPSVYRIAYNYFGCREDAEDIMQDVIIKMLTSDKEFESEEHIKSWTIRCTVNECHSLYRNPFRRKRVYPDGDNAWKDDAWWDNATGRQEDVFISETEADHEAELVRDALSRLHPRYRIALYLYYYEEYSVREIAGMLGKRESTVQTWLARGRRQMADIIEKEL